MDLSGYEIGHDFRNPDQVAAIVSDLTGEYVLLVWNHDREGNWQLGFPGGRGALKENRRNPRLAAMKELGWETGGVEIEVEEFETCEDKTAGTGKTAYYHGMMDRQVTLPLKKPGARPPEWHKRRELLSSQQLPYEQGKALTDFNQFMDRK